MLYTLKTVRSVKGHTARPWLLIFVSNVTFLLGAVFQFYADLVESPVISPFIVAAVPASSLLVAALAYGYHYIIGNNLLVEQVLSVLNRHGLKAERGSRVKGRSGAEHYFDIMASGEDATIVFDVKNSMLGVGEVAIIQMILKAVDIGVVRPVLLAIPRVNEVGRRIATTFRITVIEGRSPEELLGELETFLENLPPSKEVTQ